MQITVTRRVTEEVDAKYVVIDVPVRYGDADMPYDFPHRAGERWRIRFDADTGTIADWPLEVEADLYMKVVDGGTYRVLDANGRELFVSADDYVPCWIPGKYGDYVIVKIAGGRVVNWNAEKFSRNLYEWAVDQCEQER